MADFKLLTYRADNGRPRAGICVAERVYDLQAALAAAGRGAAFHAETVLGILQDWDKAHPAIREAADKVDAAAGMPLSETTLTAPVLYPAAIFAAGANYWDHKAEMARRQGRDPDKEPKTRLAEPWFFVKTAAHSIIGPDEPIRLPPFSQQVDWEAEIALVIGRGGKDIPEDRAMEAVAGFTILDDLSARDLSRREGSDFGFDWLGQKCFEGSAPMGPWIVPTGQVPDPTDMTIKLWVNDDLMQDSNSNQLIHNMVEQVAYLSRHVRLRPGDVVATGTPAGVGAPRGVFLKPGDTVRIQIGGIGELVQEVVAG